MVAGSVPGSRWMPGTTAILGAAGDVRSPVICWVLSCPDMFVKRSVAETSYAARKEESKMGLTSNGGRVVRRSGLAAAALFFVAVCVRVVPQAVSAQGS